MMNSSTPSNAGPTDHGAGSPHPLGDGLTPLEDQPAPLHWGIFDIELRSSPLLPSGKPDWDAMRKGAGGISAIVIWDSRTQWPHLYDDHSLEEAVGHLESLDMVVSFCGSTFDVGAIEGVLGRRLRLHAHWDVYVTLKRALDHLGIRLKGSGLGPTAERTIGLSKSGHGADAPRLAETGQWGRLFEYCSTDVRVLHSLVDHILRFGWVIAPNGQRVALSPPKPLLHAHSH